MTEAIDWSLYPNFHPDEFDCSHTGKNEMKPEALALFQAIRDRVGPLTVTSGFRDKTHPEEAGKDNPGSHAQGLAADFAALDAGHRYAIIKAAMECGAAGIGVARTFIHVDAGHAYMSRPAVWKY